MSGDFDVLVHRHLDGTLGEEEAKVFEERLKADPEARRRLAELAYEHALLKELLEPAAKRASTAPRRLQAAAAAAILVAVAVALFRPAPVKEVETPALAPKREGYQGFRGRVHARVLERKEKLRVPLRVGEVLALREASEAAAPSSLVGETIVITPPRLKDGDPPGPERDHALFLGKLQPGQEVVLELRHLDGAEFAIEALTEEQVEWARKAKGPRETPKKAEREER